MAADLFQHPKVYVVIAVEDELVGRMKAEFAKQPLVEVYVLSPRFFLQPEFTYNPLWRFDISRIIWVIQTEQTAVEIVAIARFLQNKQELTTILGLSFSPPPLYQDREVFQLLNNWKSRVEFDNDVKTRIMLNLPKVCLVIGQDVLLDSWTGRPSVSEVLALTRDNNLPDLKGTSFYWQTLEEFLAAAWQKMFNPLVGMRFWLCGKKMSGRKFAEKLGEQYQALTNNQWQIRESNEKRTALSGREGSDVVPFFAQQIVVDQDGQQVSNKWRLYLQLELKKKSRGESKQELKKIEEIEQNISPGRVEEVEKSGLKLEMKQQSSALFPGMANNYGGKNLFGGQRGGVVLEQRAEEVENLTLEQKAQSEEKQKTPVREKVRSSWVEKTSLRAQIRPLGGSSQRNRSFDPEKLIVKASEDDSWQDDQPQTWLQGASWEKIGANQTVESLMTAGMTGVSERLSGSAISSGVDMVSAALNATGLKSVKPRIKVSWLEKKNQEEKKGKSRLLVEEKKTALSPTANKQTVKIVKEELKIKKSLGSWLESKPTQVEAEREISVQELLLPESQLETQKRTETVVQVENEVIQPEEKKKTKKELRLAEKKRKLEEKQRRQQEKKAQKNLSGLDQVEENEQREQRERQAQQELAVKPDRELNEDELSLKVELEKYERVREKLKSAGLEVKKKETPKSLKKKKRKKIQRRMIAVMCFTIAILILAGGGLWLVWHESQKKYYAQIEEMLARCSSEVKCDWVQENQRVVSRSENFQRQMDLYESFIPLTTQTEFSNWEKMVEQMRKYQENKAALAGNWEKIYFALTSRSKELDAPLLWQTQENLIWQNDQLILNMITMIGKLEANSWLSDEAIAKIAAQLKQEQSRNNQVYQQVGFWRQVLGQKGTKNYGIMLNNSTLMRPGGGTTEAILDVEVNDGQITRIVPYSTAELMNKLEVKPIASGKIAEYLGQRSGTLGEVGVDGDFEVTANKALWYLQRTLNKDLDGLFAINSDLIEAELNDYGEVVLRKSGDKVDRKNYAQLMRDKSVLKNGEGEKNVFFSDLLTSFVQKQMLRSKEEIPQVVGLLEKGLKNGQITAWFNQAALEDRAKQQGVSGSMLAPDCHQLFGTMNCTSDSLYFYLTELNNEQLPEKQPTFNWQEEVVVNSQGIAHQSKLEVVSESGPSNARYYLQFYLPQNAQKIKYLMDGVQTSLDAENGLLVDFGGMSKKTILINYEFAVPARGDGEENYIYTYLQKKPVGIDLVKVDLKFTSELGKAYKIVSPAADQENMTLEFTVENEDLFVTVGL